MIRKIIAKIKNSVLYKIIFVCDYALIPPKNKKSLIERCSYEIKTNNKDELL